MSEQEEGKEESKKEGIDIERAANFFGGLQKYFRQNPKALSALLHNIIENVIDAINANEELRKHVGFAAGQLEVLTDIIWTYDSEESIQRALASSSNLEDIMDVIAILAKTYVKITSNTDIIPGEIENIIKDATTTLYQIIEYIIKDVSNGP
jgi:hypothetical protein